MATDMDTSSPRTAVVTVKTAFHTEAPRNVRFQGSTFKELKERLAAINLPGIGKDSFVEVRVGDDPGDFLCLLDEEHLPAGDLVVNVYNCSEGLQWQKTVPLDAFAAPPIQLHIDTHGHPPHHKGFRPFDHHDSHGHGHRHGPHHHGHGPLPHGPPHGHGPPPHGPPHGHGPPPHGPPHGHGPPPHGPPHGHGPPPHHEHGPDHFQGPLDEDFGKGKRGDKHCGRHKRHHHSHEHVSVSPHRRGKHCRHASRSRSPSRGSSRGRSHSPPPRGGVSVHIHHHGPRFHGRGLHHHGRMHRHHGPRCCTQGDPVLEGTQIADEPAASQAEEPRVEGDWQEVSQTGLAAQALENLEV